MLCYLPVREGTLHKIEDCNRGDVAALKALASVIRGQQSVMMMAASFEAG